MQEKNRNPQDVKIIAVTKYVSTETAQEAVSSGVEHIGENRQEGLLEKHNALGRDATWHFIGSLQSRKVKEILPYVDYIHSLDRLSLAKEIEKEQTGPLTVLFRLMYPKKNQNTDCRLKILSVLSIK